MISASNPASDDDDNPSTATIAATPIAMPSAESPARSLRVLMPMLAKRSESAIPSRAAVTGRVLIAVLIAAEIQRFRGVGDDAAVQQFHLPREPRRDGSVVRDDDDRRAVGIEVNEQIEDRLARRLVEVPRRLVRKDDLGLTDDRPGDRDALALSAGKLGWSG